MCGDTGTCSECQHAAASGKSACAERGRYARHAATVSDENGHGLRDPAVVSPPPACIGIRVKLRMFRRADQASGQRPGAVSVTVNEILLSPAPPALTR
jgi:hypothetical protein